MRLFLSFLALTFFLPACKRAAPSPSEKIVGTWLIANIPEVQKYHPRSLKLAKMRFEEEGVLRMSLDSNSVETAQWTLDDAGTLLKLKADSSRFHDPVPIYFEDDFTIWLLNDGITYQFKKIE